MTVNEASPVRTPAAGRILIVDDEEGFRSLLKGVLQERGYFVEAAADGEEALEMIRRGSFDLAISDVNMPKLSGIELLEALKLENPDIEVIMATAFATTDTAVRAMRNGAYDFVQKPFNLEEIFALVEKALEKKRLRAILGVYEISRAIFSSVDLKTLIPVVIDLVANALRADDASIMLYDGNDLRMAAYRGPESAQRILDRLAIGQRVHTRRMWKEPLVISGRISGFPAFEDLNGLDEVQSAIVCPLSMGDTFLGLININRTRSGDPFTAADLRAASIFGSQIAQAVYNAQLYGQLERKVSELGRAYEKLEAMQSQLIQTEKLAAIGQLAAGVAHELNNPLTGVLGFSQLVLESEGLTPQQREDVKSIYEQSQRCRDIVQHLLQFSRGKEATKAAIDTRPLIDGALLLMKYDMSTERPDVDLRYGDQPIVVWADGAQLQQAFLNIITNARRAMESKPGSRLTISLSREGANAIVSFSDTGCGIPVESIGKIFDPFFTTHPVGKGTGLGLSVAYGIIKNHGGTIRAESRDGEGSTFTVELPLHEL